jgi:hypothetical protein
VIFKAFFLKEVGGSQDASEMSGLLLPPRRSLLLLLPLLLPLPLLQPLGADNLGYLWSLGSIETISI